MVHYFSMVLVVWGLIIQPLMAAMPAKMTMNDHPVTQILNDSRLVITPLRSVRHEDLSLDHSMLETDDGRLAPSMMSCHGMGNAVADNSVNKNNTKICDHCQSSDCVSGCMSDSVCAASCVAFGTLISMVSSSICVSIKTRSVLFPYRLKPLLVSIPLRIFHPPKFV